MKYKLWTHQKNFSDEELVINPKNFPDIKIGDVVEIHNPDLHTSPLLVQVKSLKEIAQHKDGVISISQAIASIFHLRMYNEVHVSVVDPKDVALDLVELAYREQYFTRSDMWRLKESLTNSCLYLTQKIRYVEMRTQVHELWSKGDKVMCGFVTEDTRVTFRSSTAQVNIFIQMSCEMWEFDNYGDLYFEKAVDGFLVDLFSEWRENGCNHDVTITMFSRTFYDAKSIEEFPIHMRECVQKHSKGHFYEDFYRVVVQNERYEDWTKTLIELRRLFHEYNDRVVNYHKSQGLEGIPHSWNSTAAEGNFLEVLNMSLNVFEKYYLDRCFDRTGKLSMVITPGPGVFEVDRQLASITKHRTIDCGNSSDLVCMGEQPLHVVPLFKFYKKQLSFSVDTDDDFNIPHWINHSFYTSKSQMDRMNMGVFIPRIKMPQTTVAKIAGADTKTKPVRLPISSAIPLISDEVPFVDYDEYDAQVFKIRQQKPVLSSNVYNSSHDVTHMRLAKYPFSEGVLDLFLEPEGSSADSLLWLPVGLTLKQESETFMPHSFAGQSNRRNMDLAQVTNMAGSVPYPTKHQRPSKSSQSQHRMALYNPFTPSLLRFKVTSNRRRWAHAFPTDPRGASVQLHHKNSGSFSQDGVDSHNSGTVQNSKPDLHTIHSAQHSSQNMLKNKNGKMSDFADSGGQHRVKITDSGKWNNNQQYVKDFDADLSLEKQRSSSFSRNHSKIAGTSSVVAVDSSSVSSSPGTFAVQQDTGALSSSTKSSLQNVPNAPFSRSSSIGRDPTTMPGQNEDGINWVWGLSGEQEWTPEIKTGVDWKSMKIPASLPITTDYFPDKYSLENDYVFKNYSLLPDDINSDARSDVSSQLSTPQVYKEMVSQRIAQGFQIVMLPKTITSSSFAALSSSPYQNTSSLMRRSKIEPTEETIISIGRIFHRLTLIGPKINVTTYWPRHPFQHMNCHYIYRFQVPDSEKYDVSWTDFVYSKLENYNWNHMDSYLCTKGKDASFGLNESLQYWRAHLLLLPCNNPATKMIIEGAQHCDIYEETDAAEQLDLVHNFLHFIEMLNKLRRPTQTTLTGKKELGRKPSLTVSPGMCLGNMDRDKSTETPTAKMKIINKITDGMETPPVGSLGSSITDASLRKVSTGETPTNVSVMLGESSEPPPDHRFKSTTPLSEVVEAMLGPNDGLYFVKQQQQQQQQCGPSVLPNYCFIADEGIAWVRAHVEGMNCVEDAVTYLQSMLDDQLICHASGNHKHRFIHGFYLYYLCVSTKDTPASRWSGYYTNREFEDEWLETVSHCPTEDMINPRWSFLRDELDTFSGYEVPVLYESNKRYSRRESAVYKTVDVVVDPSHKSDRQEWGIADYNANYTPSAAFQLVIKWVVATGCILGDLIQSWARRAGQYNFHLLPVPGDPFALPFTPGSDPLRGPIFVPLEIECLKPRGMHLFEDFTPETREERLLQFQESILKRFGFLLDKCPIKSNRQETKYFVHCSGGMFAMIPDTKKASPRNRDGTHCSTQCGSLKDYIALQSGMSSLPRSRSPDDAHGSFYTIGFLWAWNYMLTKKWRSPNTGDEHYQDKMLADFRAFCSNSENRLSEYWNQCWKDYESSKRHEGSSQVPEELKQTATHDVDTEA